MPKLASAAACLAAIYPLALLACLESLSYGLLVPVLPITTTEYFARKYNHGVPIDCVVNATSAACVSGSHQANLWSSATSSAGSIVSFLIAPLVGQGSDVYGRKPFIVLAQVLHVVYPFTVLLFNDYNQDISIYFVTKFIYNAYLSGSVFAACVADVIPPHDRATGTSVTRAALTAFPFGALFAVGSVSFSVAIALTQHLSTFQILATSCAFYLLRLAWSVFCLAETLPPVGRADKSPAPSLNPFVALSILGQSALFRRLSVVVALSTFVSSGVMNYRLYFFNTVLGFGKEAIATFMLLVGISSMVSQGVLLQPLLRCVREKGVLVLSLLAYALMAALYLVALYSHAPAVVFACGVFSGLGDIGFAAISSLKSIHCSDAEQGRVQGAVYGVRAFATALGPLVFASLYATLSHSTAAQSVPFWLALVLYGASAVVACRLSVAAPPAVPESPGRTPLLFDEEMDG
ncbi:Major Facilitator Superfamily (MFS) [Achlya hypogyna]|uniref:Major Facilitator Superfamily (MFS) n=1 Tax=Achlya hypogyna TaxID=1202772 RepID=A0A1V9ZKM8_ACHHY|nr:Major Facilitator Superfamily (MFS) [Achlya hypogyna]